MSRKKQRLRYEVHLDAPELGACQRVGTLFPHEAMTQLAPALVTQERDSLAIGRSPIPTPTTSASVRPR